MSRSAGSCMTMGTASTMASLGEAMGMALPMNGSIPAADSRRAVLAERSGQRIVELVRSRETMEPLAPFNGASEEMKAVAKHLDERGLFTMIRFNGIMTNPPLPITEDLLAEGFGIIDEALDIADQAIA